MARSRSVSGHVDPLEVNQLRGPLLNAVMKSPGMRADLMDVAREIRTRYVAKVPKDTGDLSRSVRIKPIRSNSRDQRWNVDVTIGGVNGVDYADKVEARDHVLASVLRDMGYNVGDFVYGPRGKGAKSAPAKKASFGTSEGYNKLTDFIDRFQRPGRKVGSKSYDADYERLQKLTQEIEDQYGPEEATVGKVALSSYEAMREAKGLSREPFAPEQNNFRLVWFEMNKQGQQVRKSKFFNTYEQAQRYAETDVVTSGKAVPNSPRFDRLRNSDKYESGVRTDNGANLFGVIMNEKGVNG